MKLVAIQTPENLDSANGILRLRNSVNVHKCELEFFKIQATTPETLQEHLSYKLCMPHLEYTYPQWKETRVDEKTKLHLSGYRTSDVRKVFACLVSHARLWKMSADANEEIMICEHDAIFTRQFKPFKWEGGALGINDPRGATRRSNIFHDEIMMKGGGVHDVPWIDKSHIPQGLAGNSAYIIKPDFALELLNKLEELGGWPNDALMCKQVFPKKLKVCNPYFSTVQGNISTTTT